MTRSELIAACKALRHEEETLIVAYLTEHPTEPLQSLCREIDPENYNALRVRVQRAQARLEASSDASSSRTPTVMNERGGTAKREARRVLKNASPEEIAEHLLSDPEVAENVERARHVLSTPAREMSASLASAGFLNHLKAALGDLSEITADGGLTSEFLSQARLLVHKLTEQLEFAETLVAL